MSPRVIQVFEELNSFDWFANVGRKLPTEHNRDVRYVQSWSEALRIRELPENESLDSEVSDHYWLRIGTIDVERQSQWNDLIGEIRPMAYRLAELKTRDIITHFGITDGLVAHVRWDILHLAMEAEYMDICPGGLYRARSHYYWLGHFPCGWEGDWPPNGRPIVY